MSIVWRLIVCSPDRDQNKALDWIRKNDRISVGWGRIGDLRELHVVSAKDIGIAIRREYPDKKISGTGGPSLWNFYSEVSIGDLVILNAPGPASVVEVSGEYEYCEQYPLSPLSRDGTPYRHHRACLERKDYAPAELWRKAGGAAAGQNIHWALLRCQNRVEFVVPPQR